MTFEQYEIYFQEILNQPDAIAPYDDVHFMEYTKLNATRMNRWLKHGKLSDESMANLKQIDQPQRWIVITEPWCGDAAHIVPFIYKMSLVNPFIQLEIQLRDSHSEIDQYLSNGSKAIPKLIVRNDKGEDLHVWGPRPEACQRLFLEMKANNIELEEQKIALQKWYNEDQGKQIQDEISSLFRMVSSGL